MTANVGARPAIEGSSVLVDHGFVYTADAGDHVHPDGSVLIVDGRIAAVGDSSEVRRVVGDFERDHGVDVRRIDARGQMVMPGFVNGHWHDMLAARFAFGAGLRPAHDGCDQQGFFAGGGNMHTVSAVFERSRGMIDELSAAESEAIARYAVWSQLRTGTTTLGDLGSLNRPEALADAVEALGIRGAISTWASDVVCRPGEDRPARTADCDDLLCELERVFERCAGDTSDRLRARPSAVYLTNLSDELGKALADLVSRFDSTFATHIGALRNEADFVTTYFGERPVTRLRNLGLISDRLMVVHSAFLDDEEVDELLAAGVHFDHSPAKYGGSGESTMSETKLLSRLVRDGAPVSISTDGNPIAIGGMLENMRAAWQGHNEICSDQTVVVPTRALAMGTRHAAQGLGWDEVGALEVGRHGDLVLVPIHDWRFLMSSRPLEALLTLGGSADVHTVIVGGEVVMEAYEVSRADERDLEHDCVDALSSFSKRIPSVDATLVDAALARLTTRSDQRTSA